ncbi:2-hydroxyacid dehydrogenase [Leptothoe kymatousa]|uniref:Glyoxylate/hydroxypyruvate reductase A n=1 Tax=Leptothoe kymatousa TAU-MAC 1615 TaxID=2364775 RepID=A0ABS5Y6A9_9CYAN|nr:glyoxylate/hydroxypyruvate reductase A [Leptothoe kymatousa]MBT9313033.1 glyoxylate/hydroxypyruvate reductase A [Leptothoe kymatousa TAU-MAC 1615]
MALSLICPTKYSEPWVDAMMAVDPSLDLRIWPEDGNRAEVKFALVWAQPTGIFSEYPNLQVIASMGAGVDNLLQDPSIPVHVPVVRMVDPTLVRQMGDYVLAATLNHGRQFPDYMQQQQWQPLAPRNVDRITVGVMGVGQIGMSVAKRLRAVGFQVLGWSRRPKTLADIRVLVGQQQLSDFLAASEILVCLLPLTPETENILNAQTLGQLPKGAYVVNVARGNHMVEADLLALINNNHLAGACLDVFRQEPLPQGHPFWSHPKIVVTPHIASLTDPTSVATQIVENYRRMLAGEPLLNQVDKQRGY